MLNLPFKLCFECLKYSNIERLCKVCGVRKELKWPDIVLPAVVNEFRLKMRPVAVEDKHAVCAYSGGLSKAIKVLDICYTKSIIGKTTGKAGPERVGIHIVVEVLANMVCAFEDDDRWNLDTTRIYCLN